MTDVGARSASALERIKDASALGALALGRMEGMSGRLGALGTALIALGPV